MSWTTPGTHVTGDLITAAEWNNVVPGNTIFLYQYAVVNEYTNKSGGSLIAGDVVIQDTTNSQAMTTTTSAGNGRVLGVVIESISNNALGKVCRVSGQNPIPVNLDGAANVGDYVNTFTVAKQGHANATPAAGTFAAVMTATGGAGLANCLVSVAGAAGATPFAAPALTLGTSNVAGTTGLAIATDATILAFDATVPTTSAVGDSAAAGNATVAARRNHTHGREAFGTIQGLGTATANGSAATESRSDHVHKHEVELQVATSAVGTRRILNFTSTGGTVALVGSDSAGSDTVTVNIETTPLSFEAGYYYLYDGWPQSP